MPFKLQDGLLDGTHTWQNENDRVSYQRAFVQGDMAQKRIAIALLSASPLTSGDEIRAQLTAPAFTAPPIPSEPITINDIFGGGLPDAHLNDQSPTDYSGGGGSYTGSDRGTMAWF
jgi:hypothetical protein